MHLHYWLILVGHKSFLLIIYYYLHSLFTECKLNLPYRLPTLSGPLTCQLTDSCTGIQCCVEIKEIGKSIDVFVILDACNYQFAAGIEKLTFNQSLLNYEFGKKESFNLMNVFRVGLVLIMSNKYILMRLSLKFYILVWTKGDLGKQ